MQIQYGFYKHALQIRYLLWYSLLLKENVPKTQGG